MEAEDRQKRLDNWLRNERWRTKDPGDGSGQNDNAHKENSKVRPRRKLADKFGYISEEESEEQRRVMIPLDSVKGFILKSEAFLKFKRMLRNFIYPPFTSELENLAQAFISRGLTQIWTDAGSNE